MPPVPWLFLAATLVGAWFTLNAYVPFRRPALLAGLSFFAGWLTTELALHHIAWQVVATLGFTLAGAMGAWPGWVGLGLSVVSWGFLLGCHRRAALAEAVVARALEEAFGARLVVPPELAAGLTPFDFRQLLVPIPTRHRDVVRERDIVYGQGPGWTTSLDVYWKPPRKPATSPAQKRPILVQIHGGGWVIGSKNEQGLPMVLHLASRGWVCVSVDYRLAPKATFPEPLVDVKRAIAWIRANAARYGADPDFVVVAGNSAGAHLASLVALTPGEAEYQPGFEDADTSVVGCVSFYGVYDFTNRFNIWPHQALVRLVELTLFKAKLEHARDAFEKASPLSRVRADAPPFLVIHGSNDTLVPVGEARVFVEALRAVAREPVAYAEIPGAQHAFEIFPSLRTMFVIHGVERFLAVLRAGHQRDSAARAASAKEPATLARTA